MEEKTIMWQGASGNNYKYWILPIDSSWKDEPGNYIFAKETSPNYWTPLYIGETDSLKNRFPNHEKLPCVNRNGGTHIHTHTSPGGEKARKAEEADLIAKWNAPCNKE
jgi:hypothetical protein